MATAVNWRRRLDRLEAHHPALPPLTPEDRDARIAQLLEDADRPDASPGLQARAARVRELLATAEARRDKHERGYA
jgi:hypothetical protein